MLITIWRLIAASDWLLQRNEGVFHVHLLVKFENPTSKVQGAQAKLSEFISCYLGQS